MTRGMVRVHPPVSTYSDSVIPGAAYFRRSEGSPASDTVLESSPTASIRLLIQKRQQLGNNLVRRLFHQPVSRSFNDDTFNVVVYQTPLLNQKFSRRLFA